MTMRAGVPDAILGKGDGLAAQRLGQHLRDRAQRHLGHWLAVRAAEMGQHDDLGPAFGKLGDRRSASLDAGGVGDAAVLHRHVEIGAHEHALAGDVRSSMVWNCVHGRRLSRTMRRLATDESQSTHSARHVGTVIRGNRNSLAHGLCLDARDRCSAGEEPMQQTAADESVLLPWLKSYPANIDWGAEIAVKPMHQLMDDAAVRFSDPALHRFSRAPLQLRRSWTAGEPRGQGIQGARRRRWHQGRALPAEHALFRYLLFRGAEGRRNAGQLQPALYGARAASSDRGFRQRHHGDHRCRLGLRQAGPIARPIPVEEARRLPDGGGAAVSRRTGSIPGSCATSWRIFRPMDACRLRSADRQ